MPNQLTNAEIFLITTLLDLAIFVFIIRLILVAVRADYFNPVSQMIHKLTQPLIQPLRRVVPNFRYIEIASVLLILTLEFLKFASLEFIVSGRVNISGTLVYSCADFLKALINLFMYAIIIQALLSWFQPGFSPLGQLLAKITAPIMRPFQRLIPPVNGVDISPIPAIITLQLLLIVVVSPLIAFAATV